MNDRHPNVSPRAAVPVADVAPYTLAPDAVPDAAVRRLLGARRMNSVRAVLDADRRECLAFMSRWRDGEPDQRGTVLDHIRVLDAALAEVEAAERGCGHGPGECTCPCHAGVRAP